MYKQLAIMVVLVGLTTGTAAHGKDAYRLRTVERQDTVYFGQSYDSPGDDTFYDSPGDDTLYDSPGDDMFEALWFELLMGAKPDQP